MMYYKIRKTKTDLCLCNSILERQCEFIPVTLPYDENVYDRLSVTRGEFLAGMLASRTLEWCIGYDGERLAFIDKKGVSLKRSSCISRNNQLYGRPLSLL